MRPEKRGDRVRLTHCTDPHTRLTPGEEGTVSLVDAFGTVHVRWDSGSRLGLIPGADRWEVIERADADVEDHVGRPGGAVDFPRAGGDGA